MALTIAVWLDELAEAAAAAARVNKVAPSIVHLQSRGIPPAAISREPETAHGALRAKPASKLTVGLLVSFGARH